MSYCKQLIIKYLNNTISDREKHILSNWLAESEENQNLFVDFAKIWEKSHIIDYVNISESDSFVSKGLNKLTTALVLRWSFVVAASLLLCFLSYQLFDSSLFSSDNLMTYSTTDKKEKIDFPDGSFVWLNANSKIQYPSDFKKDRIVFLEGEGLFDVKKNDRKFQVKTSNISVIVHGTTFFIQDYDNTPVVEAVLASGKISLIAKELDEEFLMAPDQKLLLDKSTKAVDITEVDASNYTSWCESKLVFDNVRMSAVIIQLEKWYNVQIICKNTSLLQFPVSFSIDNESLKEVLEILQLLFPFTWENREGVIILH